MYGKILYNPARPSSHTTMLITEHAAVSVALIRMRWAWVGGYYLPPSEGKYIKNEIKTHREMPL